MVLRVRFLESSQALVSPALRACVRAFTLEFGRLVCAEKERQEGSRMDVRDDSPPSSFSGQDRKNRRSSPLSNFDIHTCKGEYLVSILYLLGLPPRAFLLYQFYTNPRIQPNVDKAGKNKKNRGGGGLPEVASICIRVTEQSQDAKRCNANTEYQAKVEAQGACNDAEGKKKQGVVQVCTCLPTSRALFSTVILCSPPLQTNTVCSARP